MSMATADFHREADNNSGNAEVRLAKNSIHTAAVEGYSSQGLGVCRVGGGVVFVYHALLGELCEIKILKEGRTTAYAKVEKILSPSPHRTAPPCPHFGKCGGCDLMHMDYEEELTFKKQRVEDALRRIGGLDVTVPEVIGSDRLYGYRNKAIYTVAEIDGAVQKGFYRPRSHTLIPTERCLIQAEVSDRAANAVLRWMKACSAPAYDEASGAGLVRRIFCRYAFATGEAQIVIVTANGTFNGKARLIEEITNACPEVVSIVINVNKSRGNTVLSGKLMTLWGKTAIEDELCSLRFSLSPLSFYQINRAQAERLYGRAIEYASLSGVETVLDLYCGTGTITLALSRRAKRVIGIEIVGAAVTDARENAKRNNITNAEFICADAFDAAKILQERSAQADVIVVDPPRKGLAPGVTDLIAELAPARVVYISCDPATLARDLKLFAAAGYRSTKVIALDMFPRTAHVETVVLLTRVP